RSASFDLFLEMIVPSQRGLDECPRFGIAEFIGGGIVDDHLWLHRQYPANLGYGVNAKGLAGGLVARIQMARKHPACRQARVGKHIEGRITIIYINAPMMRLCGLRDLKGLHAPAFAKFAPLERDVAGD